MLTRILGAETGRVLQIERAFESCPPVFVVPSPWQ